MATWTSSAKPCGRYCTRNEGRRIDPLCYCSFVDEREWPLPVRTVCDTPQAVLDAIGTLKEWGEAVIVEHNGRRMAAIIPMDDLELYQRLLAEEEDRADAAAAALARAEGGAPIPWEEVRARLAL